jgi:hypothetical protein
VGAGVREGLLGAIAAASLLSLDRGKGCKRPPLVRVLVEPRPAGGADPTPSSDENDTPEQIPLHVQAVEARHVARRIDPSKTGDRERQHKLAGRSRSDVAHVF